MRGERGERRREEGGEGEGERAERRIEARLFERHYPDRLHDWSFIEEQMFET